MISILRQNEVDVFFFSFFSLSLRPDSFYHIMQLGVTVYFLRLM